MTQLTTFDLTAINGDDYTVVMHFDDRDDVTETISLRPIASTVVTTLDDGTSFAQTVLTPQVTDESTPADLAQVVQNYATAWLAGKALEEKQPPPALAKLVGTSVDAATLLAPTLVAEPPIIGPLPPVRVQ